MTRIVAENKVTRRNFLYAGAAGGLVLASGCAATGKMADAASSVISGGDNSMDVYTRSVGDIRISTVLDGYFPLEQEIFNNITDEQLKASLRAHYRNPDKPVDLGISAHLIEAGGKTILVDTGAANQFGPTAGRLSATLTAMGYEAADIDEVILTHMHPDHIGGAIADGEAVFGNAGLHVADKEAEFWSSENNREQAPDQFKSMFDLASSVLEAYGERVNRFTGDVDLVSGITAQAMPGHTVGHTGYLIESDGKQLMLWGDMTAVASVQFSNPDAGIAFDTDSTLAAKTRRRILDRVASERLLIAGTHLPYPAYGHVETNGSAYRYVAEEYQYG